MGKGNRVRTQNADERKAKKEAAVKKAAKEKLSQRITVIVSAVLAVALVFGFIWAAFLKDFVGRQSLKNSITMKTENFSVSAAEFSYLYMSTYLQVQQYATYYGYDFSTDIPLKDQPCSQNAAEGYTWHDFFVDQTKTAVKELLVLCEAAKERNITLTDEEKKTIEDSITELKSAAEQQNLSFNKFMSTYFGNYITEEDVRSCMEKQTLAGKAAEAIENEPKYTADQLAAERENNKASYYYSDYRFIEIKANYVTGASDEAIEEAKAKAKTAAEKILNATTDVDSFLEAVEAYYRENNDVVADKTEDAKDESADKNDATADGNTEATEAETEEPTDTEEKPEEESKDEEKKPTLTEDELRTKLNATLKKRYAYEVDKELGKWLFHQADEGENKGQYDRKAGDATLIEDKANGKYTVYVVVNPYYYDDYKVRDVRHILIKLDSYDKDNGLPDADAKAKAEEILAKWKEGDATEDSFGELAKEHSMDGDPSNGGLYEGVYKGQMVTEFEDWLFADERKVGDTDIVKTTYGYHVMYYVGEGEDIKWETDAEANLRTEDYKKAYEALTQKYAITYDEKALKKVKQAGT